MALSKSLALLCCATALAFAQQRPLTTNTGSPVGDNQNSKTAGENGPVLLEDIHLIEKLANFDRERIPERVVHARGAGAHGTFESYGDFSKFTKAAFLSGKGKSTPVFVRFSTVIHSNGSPETLRDPRGFAVKFYTDQGNYDLVGNNLPVFFIRDAMKFPDMVHSLKPSPVDNRQKPARFFDFFSSTPESTQMLTFLYSDLGIPANYREMNGFGVHAFKWINASGDYRYVKYTWTSGQGVKGLTADQASAVQAKDFQHATHDLYDSIAKGQFPTWELSVQMMAPEDLDKFDFNPLDATKTWPEKIAPSMKIGKMVLNKTPENFFETTEQSAFSPGALVPGIEASEDRLLQGRLFSYFDTQRHRVGANFLQLAINRPAQAVNSNSQDGALSTRGRKGDVNYEPSRADQVSLQETSAARYSTRKINESTMQKAIAKKNNFAQAGELYLSMDETGRANLIKHLAGDLSQVENKAIRLTMVSHFYQANAEYGQRLAKALNLSLDEVKAAITAATSRAD